MKSLVQKLMLLSLALAIALPLAAQDKEKKKKGGGEPGAIAQIKKALASVDLKEEQKKKIDDLVAQYMPKLREATKAAGDAPKKVADAKKKVKEEGKKGKEAAAAVKDAAKLTADEQSAMEKLESVSQDFRTAVMAVLTDEQKEKAGLNKGKKKKGA
jgi:Spy/CpxP family protein refolding chaperone